MGQQLLLRLMTTMQKRSERQSAVMHLGDDGADWRAAAIAGKHAEAGPLVQKVPMPSSDHEFRNPQLGTPVHVCTRTDVQIIKVHL